MICVERTNVDKLLCTKMLANAIQVQQEAEERLPAEPDDSSPTACRIAIRMPDGSRAQRRFSKTDQVQVRCSGLILCDFIEAWIVPCIRVYSPKGL